MPSVSVRVGRSISYSAAPGTPAISTDGIEPGDVITVVHSADLGTLDQMTISGGGTWTPKAARTNDDPFGSGGGTKVWQKIAGSSEPSSYQLTHAGGARSTVSVVAARDASFNDVVVAIDQTTGEPPVFVIESVATPGASPASGSSLELRAAIIFSGFGSLGVTTHWTTPGLTEVTSNQSSDYVASIVAERTLVSSSPVDDISFGEDQVVTCGHGITIIIPSGQSTIPTPPSFPAFTPARGTSLYRYTIHDLITGAYKADIQPIGVYFDRRIGEAGTFSGTLPIPNERVADQIAKVIPRTSAELQSGPGRIVVHIWRAGSLWGIYWIHGAIISKDDEGNISIQLRGSSLEAYLLHVAVDTDLTFTGDQITNARSLLTHLMSDPTANVGLALQGGTSGVVRTLAVLDADDKNYGDSLWGYSKASGGFEWTVDPRVIGGAIQRAWIWGYPKLVGSTVHTFTESPTGGDIKRWSEELDALRGGTRTRVRGGTPEPSDATAGSAPMRSGWVPATAHLAAGWPRLDQTVDHPDQSIISGELTAFANRWIATFAGALRVYPCAVELGARPTISPSSLGDQVRRLITNAWYPRKPSGGAGFDQQQRLIGIGIRPTARDAAGKDEAELVLEEPGL